MSKFCIFTQNTQIKNKTHLALHQNRVSLTLLALNLGLQRQHLFLGGLDVLGNGPDLPPGLADLVLHVVALLLLAEALRLQLIDLAQVRVNFETLFCLLLLAGLETLFFVVHGAFPSTYVVFCEMGNKILWSGGCTVVVRTLNKGKDCGCLFGKRKVF